MELAAGRRDCWACRGTRRTRPAGAPRRGRGGRCRRARPAPAPAGRAVVDEGQSGAAGQARREGLAQEAGAGCAAIRAAASSPASVSASPPRNSTAELALDSTAPTSAMTSPCTDAGRRGRRGARRDRPRPTRRPPAGRGWRRSQEEPWRLPPPRPRPRRGRPSPATGLPPGDGARQRVEVGLERGVQPLVVGRVVTDDVERGCSPGGRCAGSRCRWPGPDPGAAAWRPAAGHPRVAVGRAGGDALEQGQDTPHRGHVVQGGDEVHLGGPGVGEAHVHPGVDESADECLRAVHCGLRRRPCGAGRLTAGAQAHRCVPVR